MNLTPGINTEINGISIDFYTIWYIYPDTSGSGNDYVEYAGGLGYDFGVASLGVSYTYSPDYSKCGRISLFRGKCKCSIAVQIYFGCYSLYRCF